MQRVQGSDPGMSDLDQIYSDRIVELAAGIPPARRLPSPDATATAHSKLCGSTVTVDLKMTGGQVSDFGQTVRACLLGQAAASVVARHIVGAEAAELREIGATMRRMLKADGPPPAGKWAELAVLQPVKDYKARHASTLLVFDAVEAALGEIEARQAQGAAAAP
jgi:NifU-like protein involved in Fe-S cluster formation